MKSLLLAPLFLGFIPFANANVDPEIHKLCLPAADYLGCVKAMTTKSTSIPSMRMIDGGIETSGNFCPNNHAYVGGGYCQEIACKDNSFTAQHDPKLKGKGWKVCAKNFFRSSMFFKSATVRATTDGKCPLVEPEIGRNNSCQNGLSEEEIINSNDPLINFYPPEKKKKVKTDVPSGSVKINCDSPVWKNKPRCN